jgi:AcrR family transcriptional regulator
VTQQARAKRGFSPERGGAEEDRAGQLLSAASQLFVERGYDATSVHDIASVVGVTGAAIYRHFRGKQDLLGQVLLAELERLTEMIESIVTAGATACRADRIRTLTGSAAGVAVEGRALSALWRWESRNLDQATRRLLRRRGAMLTGRCAAVLRGCRPELSTRDARRLAWGAMSVFGSVADHRVTPAKRHFTATLAGIAERVLTAELPRQNEQYGVVESPVAWGLTSSRRQQILVAATRLFAERGYRAVSMEDIGAAVGLAAPSVYRHYGSKHEILLLAARNMGARLTMQASEVLATQREPWSPAAALSGIVESYVETTVKFRDLVAVYSHDAGYLPRSGRAELVGMQRDYVAQWVELLRAADPSRGEQAARVAVHSALAVVNDLSRASWIESGRVRQGDLVAMAKAAMGVCEDATIGA